MTQTPLQSSTYSEFGSFPSAEGHPYTSINRSVELLVESDWVEVEALFEIGYGGNLVSIPFRLAAHAKDGQITEALYSKNSALDDLRFLKEAFDEWHTEAVRAFDEFPT